MARANDAQKATVKAALHKYYKKHSLHSGPDKYGHMAKGRAQAIAIALSEAGLGKSKKK